MNSSRSYPGANVDSDHILVAAKCNIHFRKHRVSSQKKWYLHNLEDAVLVQKFKEATNVFSIENTEWDNIKESLMEAATKVLGNGKLEPRKPWIAHEILALIDKRNKLRNKDFDHYRIIKNLITRKCRLEKDRWMEEVSEEIEKYLLSGNPNKAYTKIKALQYKPKTKSNIVKEGRILLENENVCDRWKECIEDLYNGEEVVNTEEYIENVNSIEEDTRGPPITKQNSTLH